MPSRLVSICEIVDGQVVHAGGQDAEVPAVEDGEIAQRHVAAKLERDGFVAASAALPARQRLAADQRRPPTIDDVLQAFAPDQAVVEMAVAEVLKLVPLVGLRRIVGGRIARTLRALAPGSNCRVRLLRRRIEPVT